METIEIKGTPRKTLGKKSANRIRSEGHVPCVLYGGEEVVHFYAPELSFNKVVYTPKIYLLKIDVEGKKYDALLQEVQYHPVTDRILHIDFKEFQFGEEVITLLPVIITGESVGIKAGGKLRQRRRRLKVKGLPKDLPDHLEIDITDLDIGDSLKIGDLNFENLTLLDTPRAMVVAVASSRIAKGMAEVLVEEEEVAEEEGAEEVAEGEEAPAAETEEGGAEEETKTEE
jgi:large subunit ribosomal protein L25